MCVGDVGYVDDECVFGFLSAVWALWVVYVVVVGVAVAERDF